MKHLTMQELNELGFEIVRNFSDDEFMEQVRRKGNITIETTWLISGGFVSQEVLIPSIELKLSPKDIKKLDKILNKK